MYLLACQVRVAAIDSDHCVYVTSFQLLINSLPVWTQKKSSKREYLLLGCFGFVVQSRGPLQ